MPRPVLLSFIKCYYIRYWAAIQLVHYKVHYIISRTYLLATAVKYKFAFCFYLLPFRNSSKKTVLISSVRPQGFILQKQLMYIIDSNSCQVESLVKHLNLKVYQWRSVTLSWNLLEGLQYQFTLRGVDHGESFHFPKDWFSTFVKWFTLCFKDSALYNGYILKINLI